MGEATTPMAVQRTVIENKLAVSELTAPVTPADRLFVRAHLGIPEIAAAGWSCPVDGLVRQPLTLDRATLARFPRRTLETVHKCAGSPLNPKRPTYAVANVVWGGVDLRDVLAAAEVDAGATHLWAYGLDHGTFAKHAAPHYLKDIPLERVAEGDVLIADELNGAPLAREHGHPARLVVPGFYGTNSVKWLGRLTLAAERADSLFTRRFYNDGAEGAAPVPVWALAPECAIVAPAADATLDRVATEIRGWAWSSVAVAGVEVSTDGGDSWQPTILEPARGRAWQGFSLRWQPARDGTHELRCRATDVAGTTQPDAGARNAVHVVRVTVAG